MKVGDILYTIMKERMLVVYVDDEYFAIKYEHDGLVKAYKKEHDWTYKSLEEVNIAIDKNIENNIAWYKSELERHGFKIKKNDEHID